jgi:outer membrane protein, multidrug efflux system
MPCTPCPNATWPAVPLGLALALLSACAPWAQRPLPATRLDTLAPPAQWQALVPPATVPTPTALADTLWWQHFNDPVLLMLHAQAQRANPSLYAAEAAVRQARALAQGAQAGLQPQLGSSASAQRQGSDGSSAGTLFAVGLDASWELDLFGAQRSAVAALQAGAEASRAQLGAAQTSLGAEVGLRYIALRSLQTRLAVATRNAEAQGRTLQIADWRNQAGLLSALELAQARSAAQQTAAQLPALRGAALQAQAALAVLTGQAPGALAPLLQIPGPVPVPDTALALSLPAETLRQRPDVRAAEWQLRAAESRVHEADAARWPSLALSGSLGLQALRLGSLGSGPLLSSLLAAARWPVWDGGGARARLTASEAALDQARAAYRGTLLTALQEVEDALVALQSDAERSAALAEAAAAAETAAQLAGLRFRSGLVDFQTVLTTERAQLLTQDAWVSARADWSASHVRLFKALGGGWQPGNEGRLLAQGQP